MSRNDILPIAAAAVFIAVLAAQIWTYASGQDAATYMDIARGMQQWIRDEPVLTHHLKLVAPFYPLVLAVVRELGGPLAGYWVNPLVCAAWLVLVGRLAARCTGEGRHVFPVMLMTALVAFLGYGLFPHFALYPFRSPLMLALMFTGFLLVRRAAQKQSMNALVGGWLVLLLAGLTREFALIGWIVCGIWWWGEVRHPVRLRWTGLALFFGPILLGGASAPLWILSSGSEQIHVFVTIILRQAFEQGAPFLWQNFTGICTGLMKALGPLGLLCLGLGFWHTRRNRAVRWLMLAPGLFLAFAYTPFLVHHRYLQESLAFLAILAGIGLGQMCEWLRLRCPPDWRRISPLVVQGAVLVFFVVPPMLSASPVFGRVTAWEIRHLLKRLPQSVKDGHHVVLNHTEGRLWEVLQANTRLMCLDAAQAGLPVAGSPPVNHYMESVNGEGWSPKKLLRQRSGHAMLQDHFDLSPWPESFTLGGAEYLGWTCLPRTGTVSRAKLILHSGPDKLLFVDLGGQPTHGNLLIMDHNGKDLCPPCPLVRAQGWTILGLPARLDSGGVARIRLEATSPVPADLNPFVVPMQRAVELPLGVMRRSSTMAMFDPPSRAPAAAPYGVLISGRGVFTAPAVPSDAPELYVALWLRRADLSPLPLEVRLFRDGTQIGAVTMPPLNEGDVWLGPSLPVNDGGRTSMEIQVVPGPDRQAVPVWVTAVRFLTKPR